MTPRRWAAAALLGAILLTGCSSDKNKDESASPATTAGEAPATTRRVAGGPFCQFLATFDDRFSRLAPDATNPQQLRTSFQEAVKAIEGAEPLAPPEIQPDVRLLATTFRDFVGTLEQVNYDFTKVPPSSLDRLSRPDVQAAGDHLDSYVRQNCRAG